MLVLAIDPSSTRTGYALMPDPATILEAGLFKPKKSDPAEMRIDEMVEDLGQLLARHIGKITDAVVETPSAHTGKQHKGKGAGLALYGLAVGQMRQALKDASDFLRCEEFANFNVHHVRPNEWTRSIKKTQRASFLRAYMPDLDLSKDTGLDVADAIQLAQWFLRKNRLGRATT